MPTRQFIEKNICACTFYSRTERKSAQAVVPVRFIFKYADVHHALASSLIILDELGFSGLLRDLVGGALSE